MILLINVGPSKRASSRRSTPPTGVLAGAAVALLAQALSHNSLLWALVVGVPTGIGLLVDETTGVELLQRSRHLCPEAKRTIIWPYGDMRALEPLYHAMALGAIDDYLTRPWIPVEHGPYRPVGELLGTSCCGCPRAGSSRHARSGHKLAASSSGRATRSASGLHRRRSGTGGDVGARWVLPLTRPYARRRNSGLAESGVGRLGGWAARHVAGVRGPLWLRSARSCLPTRP